jgi:tetratricopeptide (TPR) repeat protein
MILSDFYAGRSAVLEDDLKKAEAFSDSIRMFIERNDYEPVLLDYHFMLLAEIYTARKKTVDALKILEKVSNYTRPDQNYRIIHAKICIQKEDFDKAIAIYKRLYGKINALIEGSRIHYNIARLYEQKGEKQQAIEYYEKTLEQWEHADEDLPELIESKERLVKLKG